MALKPYRATAHWKKIRIKVLQRDAYTCAYCGDVAAEVDHVYPKSKGGEDTLDNLVAACRSCNSRKKDTIDSVFLGSASTPPAFSDKKSPIGSNQSKLVQNGHTTIRIDADSPFSLPDQSGAN
jgi:hypothetical protein